MNNLPAQSVSAESPAESEVNTLLNEYKSLVLDVKQCIMNAGMVHYFIQYEEDTRKLDAKEIQKIHDQREMMRRVMENASHVRHRIDIYSPNSIENTHHWCGEFKDNYAVIKELITARGARSADLDNLEKKCVELAKFIDNNNIIELARANPSLKT